MKPTTLPAIAPAAEIVALHNEITHAAHTSLEKAIRIGELLAEQKATLKHGGWLAWLKESVPFTSRTATNYIRLFTHRDKLKSEIVSDLGDAVNQLQTVGHRQINRAIELEERKKRDAAFKDLPDKWSPVETGQRQMRVARKDNRFMVVVGPTVSPDEMQLRIAAAKESSDYKDFRSWADEAEAEAEALEQQAKKLRAQAREDRKFADLIVKEHCDNQDSKPFYESFEFEATGRLLKKLSNLDPQVTTSERARIILETKPSRELVLRQAGMWGDFQFLNFTSQCIQHRPETERSESPGERDGWSVMGSPEWIHELWPNA
ncbi:MAG TPA: DUF3102 domain-containing protein [Methylomirabilota bacterium]|nr:DUF3102 domain-containing protein [Methylomirabilota bacterium]